MSSGAHPGDTEPSSGDGNRGRGRAATFSARPALGDARGTAWGPDPPPPRDIDRDRHRAGDRDAVGRGGDRRRARVGLRTVGARRRSAGSDRPLQRPVAVDREQADPGAARHRGVLDSAGADQRRDRCRRRRPSPRRRGRGGARLGSPARLRGGRRTRPGTDRQRSPRRGRVCPRLGTHPREHPVRSWPRARARRRPRRSARQRRLPAGQAALLHLRTGGRGALSRPLRSASRLRGGVAA